MEPGKQLDRIGDGLGSGVSSGFSGIVSALQSAGKAVMSGLDEPFQKVTGKQGPHRILDRAADGLASATTNAINTGIIGSAESLAHGLTNAIDQPFEELAGGLKLPKIGK